MAMTADPLERLNVSLPDFEQRSNPSLYDDYFHHPRHPRYHDPDLDFSDLEPEGEISASVSAAGSVSLHEASAGGYSPPAWRRLGNGRRDSGFWRGADGLLGIRPPRPSTTPLGHPPSRSSSPEFDSANEGDADDYDELARAIRTRLPTGSQSPVKDRSRSLEPNMVAATTALNDLNVKFRSKSPSMPRSRGTSENYIHFAVHADIRQRTEPIDSAINFFRTTFRTATRSWTSFLLSTFFLIFSISSLRALSQPPTARPVGDLVKVAGVARSFEPLIYYSEHAVAQVHDLQATSIAVWDLGESVRTSTMRDAGSIVSDLDALSDTMKTLAIEMTKFFASVDGDVDGILNVMDWARMHLARLQQHPGQGSLSAVYDNIHNMLSAVNILEDASGNPTAVGTITAKAFGLSNPQRTQRMVQLLFTEFLVVLEGTVKNELQHTMTLFALFEAIDNHFLNLVRSVARESSAQEELHADLLSSLWTRILGAKASELKKYEENRQLLRDVRAKTVRNKGVLVEHNGKLLTLKASLESLRAKLVSPLVRGVNSTTLTLEDQIRGLDEVGSYLQTVRRQQKSKVMEMLFASVPSKSHLIADRSAPGAAGTGSGRGEASAW